MCGLFSAPFLLGTNYLRLMISTAPKQQLKEEKKTENRHDLLLNRLFQSSLFPSPPHPQPLFMEVLTHPGDV